MPFCRNCKSRISKFDKDICPICGTNNPLEGAESDTVEITTNVSTGDQDFANYKPHTRKALLLWFCFLGFSGAPYYYLGDKQTGTIYMLGNVFSFAIIVSLMIFAFGVEVWLSFVVSIAIIYLLNIIAGIIYYFLPNLQDKDGEYLH